MQEHHQDLSVLPPSSTAETVLLWQEHPERKLGGCRQGKDRPPGGACPKGLSERNP